MFFFFSQLSTFAIIILSLFILNTTTPFSIFPLIPPIPGESAILHSFIDTPYNKYAPVLTISSSGEILHNIILSLLFSLFHLFLYHFHPFHPIYHFSSLPPISSLTAANSFLSTLLSFTLFSFSLAAFFRHFRRFWHALSFLSTAFYLSPVTQSSLFTLVTFALSSKHVCSLSLPD
jgi:hypothetical protein